MSPANCCEKACTVVSYSEFFSGDFSILSSITSLPEFFHVFLHLFVWSTVYKWISAARKTSWFLGLTEKEVKVESSLCEGTVTTFCHPCRDGEKFL